MPTKVIVTTDPGQDEAAALMMMLAAPESFEILGLVATAGNIGLDHTVINALKILELANRADIPVFAGCPQPIRRKLVIADHVHGPTGLDGHDLPPPATSRASNTEWTSSSRRCAPRSPAKSILRPFPLRPISPGPGPGARHCRPHRQHRDDGGCLFRVRKYHSLG